MDVTIDQAIEIHARALTYRHGGSAESQARERAQACQSCGDNEGHQVWEKVAETVAHIRNVQKLGHSPG
ncbi:MAG: hypothetical protein RL735_1873 [Pseudomonadota bacterium]